MGSPWFTWYVPWLGPPTSPLSGVPWLGFWVVHMSMTEFFWLQNLVATYFFAHNHVDKR